MSNQYKSKYAKSQSNTKIFFLGVGTVTIFFTILILLAVFQPFKIRDYSGMNRITAVEIFSQEETEYYVYFYSPTCAGCIEVKPSILEYANYSRNGKNGRSQIYVVNVNNLINQPIIKNCSTSQDPNCQTTNIFTANSSDISGIQVATTPSMLKISNGRIASASWSTVSGIRTELTNVMETSNQAQNQVVFLEKRNQYI
jgi:hypothetical protein